MNNFIDIIIKTTKHGLCGGLLDMASLIPMVLTFIWLSALVNDMSFYQGILWIINNLKTSQVFRNDFVSIIQLII